MNQINNFKGTNGPWDCFPKNPQTHLNDVRQVLLHTGLPIRHLVAVARHLEVLAAPLHGDDGDVVVPPLVERRLQRPRGHRGETGKGKGGCGEGRGQAGGVGCLPQVGDAPRLSPEPTISTPRDLRVGLKSE